MHYQLRYYIYYSVIMGQVLILRAVFEYPKIPIKGRALYSRTNVFRVPAEALKVRKSKKGKRNYRSTLKVAD